MLLLLVLVLVGLIASLSTCCFFSISYSSISRAAHDVLLVHGLAVLVLHRVALVVLLDGLAVLGRLHVVVVVLLLCELEPLGFAGLAVVLQRVLP